MKIFSILNSSDNTIKEIAWLFFYERSGRYYIELSEELGFWDAPFVFDSIIKKGHRTIPFFHSRLWLLQRIVPPDRQNIGSIIRESGLDCYDEFKLFEISKGRCAQDDCFIRKTIEKDLPASVVQRRKKRLISSVANGSTDMMLVFDDGRVSVLELSECKKDFPWLSRLTKYNKLSSANVGCGGSSLEFEDGLEISYEYLYDHSTALPVSLDTLNGFAKETVVSTSEAMELLSCTRQNINEYVKKGRLVPIKQSGNNTLFLKNDIINL